jgi:hypothetical protein
LEDAILVAKPGQKYGFPTCKRQWGKRAPKACKGFADPRIALPVDAAPYGIGSVGKTLYVSLAQMPGDPDGRAAVATIPTGGGDPPKLFLSAVGFDPVGLGIHAGRLYVGDLFSSRIYSVEL